MILFTILLVRPEGETVNMVNCPFLILWEKKKKHILF